MLDRREAQRKVVSENPYFALENIEVDGIPWRVYRDAPGSLREVLQATIAFGDRPVLVYEDRRWSYAEHLRIVSGLARRWSSWGVTKGDRVAIAMRNYPEWVMSFWAAQALGAVAVPLNAWWTGDELAYALGDSQPKLLVADAERAERIAPSQGELGIERVIAVRARHAPPSGVLSWEEELAELDPNATLPDVVIDAEDDATIMYTSGTTGFPKGAIATQRNHITNLRNTELSVAVTLEMLGIAMPADPPQISSLQTFPFFHIGGLSGLYIGTAVGAKLCLMYKWDTAEAVEIIQKESVNSAAMVPTLLRRLLEYAGEHDIALESLSGMAAGGAPVPADLIRRMEHQFERRVSPANGYGLTETTSAVVANSGTEYFAHPDSVGRPAPGADLRIVDPGTGQDQPPGTIGELWFRGPNIVRGYWNKPAETAASFTDGWFHTGDLGYVDADGLVYVVDRLKDVIIRAGENVYCAEVEAVIYEHPGVADVALIGVPHESWGEEVVAVVELQPGAQLTETELQEHVAGRLARFKVPTQVHFVGEPLPRTATGKVLKRDLRDRYSPVSS